MKYLYGDSTESPLKVDFLGMMEDYLDTSIKAIKLENTVSELNNDIRARRRLRNSLLEEMDGFVTTVEEAIFKAVSRSKEQDALLQYADKSKHFMKKFIDDGKREFSNDISKEISQFEDKINEINGQTGKVLESFFNKDPVPIINKKYTLKATKEGYSANVRVDCEGDISYLFTMDTSKMEFWTGHKKGYEFLRGVGIPARMKKPLFKNENVPDIVTLDYYFLTNLIYSDEKLEVVFRKSLNISSERFRLKMDFGKKFGVEVFHAEENGVEKNIKAIPELNKEIKTHRINEIGEIIVKNVESLYPNKLHLENVYLSGIDVLAHNSVVDLMMKIAEVFSPIIVEIKNHSPSDKELSLKMEDKTGKRGEIYLKKSQVRNKLKEINEKGDQLIRTLRID